ncbi:MAG: molybdenum ABC transporter permease subunit [Novosphingobium sp. 28-62-57]|uniref:molybdate ABC transporter permease subunit n=1 Tax=unclassified Novosphingobium TaxID=2644732 RepID=UPI000BD4AE00|nr:MULTISPECIES: molybdate ABC transporter permease subunit [unclassified Novosphingobium]OYW49936.1 MAG: molybdenum ABC transporter permease subunit [Novosphingobium sp. 12-62-10]OYZ12090.1 MAG: molybdenum ABC transporter permease subunit [Novosphingobium sp. 28-62-57]OZA39205.1 MAG: molybdenum ABC transporter permease subunit [Novosphingobium sp. 17-62-9]HQS68675.1 molybdate ABC transporter permease subunit [Novosphingobium sp.]
MDWQALHLSLLLGLLTIAILLPVAIVVGRWLATTHLRGRAVIEAVLTLPLVLPPTVIGFYLLVGMGPDSPIGRAWTALFGGALVFSFEGILVASVLVNLPFAIQPAQRAFESIGQDLRDAAATCGHSLWRTIWRIELPLAWPGIVTGVVLAFAHTLGEFGVVLMVGGSIPGETRTLALSIYDRVQAFDNPAAARMAAVLMAISLVAVTASFVLSRRTNRHG